MTADFYFEIGKERCFNKSDHAIYWAQETRYNPEIYSNIW